MTDREARSSSQQIMYCYGANRRAEAPARLLVVGLTGRQAASIGERVRCRIVARRGRGCETAGGCVPG